MNRRLEIRCGKARRHRQDHGEIAFHVAGGKITQQFQRIEAAELEDKLAADNGVRLADERKS